MPGLRTLDIIELAQVGTHNPQPDLEGSSGQALLRSVEQMRAFDRDSPQYHRAQETFMHAWAAADRASPEPWLKVRDVMARVMDACPFAIQAADAAGLQATFLSPVMPQQAAAFIDLVVNAHFFDSLDCMAHHPLVRGAAEEEDDEVLAAERYVIAANGLPLWWD